MLSFDQLRTLPDNVKLGYLKVKVEALIQDSPGHLHLSMRLLQAKMDRIRKQHSDHMTAAWLMQDAMLEYFQKLREALDPPEIDNTHG